MDKQIDEQFNEIYDKTYHTTLKYIISKCDNLSNVEEIVQEVYIKLYKQIKKDSTYIKNYNQFLIKLAKNELFKYYSIKNKFKVILNVSLEEKIDYIENLKDENIKIEEDIEGKYDTELIWKELKKLKLITQKIVTLYYLENIKIKEIAETLEINESTVKSNLYRGIKKVKEELERGELYE